MIKNLAKKFVGTGLLFSCTLALSAEAAIPTTYTNNNFLTATHDVPVSFTRQADGSFYGMTEMGKSFTQRPVVADMHVGLECFSIDEARFYVSNLGLISANSDTEALSIYLARAGWEEETV
jgi:hypothetical protein